MPVVSDHYVPLVLRRLTSRGFRRSPSPHGRMLLALLPHLKLPASVPVHFAAP